MNIMRLAIAVFLCAAAAGVLLVRLIIAVLAGPLAGVFNVI